MSGLFFSCFSENHKCMNQLNESIAIVLSSHVIVRSIVRFVFLNSIATSIWLYGVWSPFIFTVFGNSHAAVGWIAAITGLFEMSAAFVGGYLADKRTGRINVLRCALGVGAAGLTLTLVTAFVTPTAMPLYLIGQSMYGAFLGLSLASAEALMADCVPLGSRDKLYSIKYSLEASGPIVGCVCSIVLFLVVGDQWSTVVLLSGLTVGIGLHVASMAQLLVALRQHDIHGSYPTGDTTRAIPATPRSAPKPHCAAATASSVSVSSVAATAAFTEKPRSCPLPFPRLVALRRIPLFVVAQDTIIIVGSGLTTMYFSLFMIEDYHCGPIMMAFMSGVCGLLTMAFTVGFGQLSLYVGRVQSITIPKAIGALLLLFIAVGHDSKFSPLPVMFVAYSVRYGCMNCCTGITRALLMDLVPPSQRARWSAIESLQSASWSGTSVLGGYVTDHYGYGRAFFTTFLFHLAGVSLLALCLGTNDLVDSSRSQSVVLAEDPRIVDEADVPLPNDQPHLAKVMTCGQPCSSID